MYQFKAFHFHHGWRTPRISIHLMYQFKKSGYKRELKPSVFQYISCISSRRQGANLLRNIYIISIHLMYQFKIITNSLLNNKTGFQYISCISSRLLVQIRCSSLINFNTSHVSVQDKTDLVGKMTKLFQYISCISSRRSYSTSKSCVTVISIHLMYQFKN